MLAVVGGLHCEADVRAQLKIFNEIYLSLVHFPIDPSVFGACFPALFLQRILTLARRFGLAGATRDFARLKPPKRLLLIVARTDDSGQLTFLADGLC